jgi:hypothetical protein
MQLRPVLYLDLDDTVIRWTDGVPSGAAGIREFLHWALDAFEVRWLTRWARNGVMEPRLLHDLERMSAVPASRLAGIRGIDWHETDCKLNGIAWLEHTLLQRGFLWLEDETIGTRATDFLARHGFADAHRCCNVSRDPHALQRLHDELAASYGTAQSAA